MVKYGVDTAPNEHIAYAVKQWPGKGITAAILLTSYGTVPRRNAVCPDCHKKCLDIMQDLLQNQFEDIAESNGASDLRFVAAKIKETCQRANKQIYEINAFIGQGIYIGGVICYVSEIQCLVLPFGGGQAYLWLDGKMAAADGKLEADKYISDAIGNKANWNSKFWQYTVKTGSRVICATSPLPDLNRAAQHILECEVSGKTFENTVAILLRQDMNTSDNGIIDLQF